MSRRQGNARVTIRKGQSGGPSTMRLMVRRLHRGLAWLILVGLGGEVYLVGAPLFGATTFQPHRALGYALAIAILLFLILAVVAQRGRRIVGLATLLVALKVLEVLLPSLRTSLPWVAALHAINALALIGATAAIARSPDAEPTPIQVGESGGSAQGRVWSVGQKVAAS